MCCHQRTQRPSELAGQEGSENWSQIPLEPIQCSSLNTILPWYPAWNSNSYGTVTPNSVGNWQQWRTVLWLNIRESNPPPKVTGPWTKEFGGDKEGKKNKNRLQKSRKHSSRKQIVYCEMHCSHCYPSLQDPTLPHLIKLVDILKCPVSLHLPYSKYSLRLNIPLRVFDVTNVLSHWWASPWHSRCCQYFCR